MHVLMFCPQFAPIVGGAERQAEKLAKELLRQRVEVSVWTPHLDPRSPRHEIVDGLAIHRFRLDDLAARFPGIRGIGLVNGPWLVAQIMFHLWRPLRSAQVLHCHIGSLQTVVAGVAARLAGVPVICKAAVAADQSDLGEMARQGLTGRLMARLSRHVFHRWIATTNAVREALLRSGVEASRILVIPSGVELPPPRARHAGGPVRRFLYLGRLSTNSNRDVPTLIHAFDRLADEVADVELAVVGGGDLLDETRRIAAAAANRERIRVTGPGDPNHWLAWADAFVLPSRKEGLSNALLEAMAMGLPCIANDIPPNREVLGGGTVGLLVPVGCTECLHDALMLFVSRPEQATTYAIDAKCRVSRFYSIGIVASRYALLYDALHSAPRRMRSP